MKQISLKFLFVFLLNAIMFLSLAQDLPYGLDSKANQPSKLSGKTKVTGDFTPPNVCNSVKLGFNIVKFTVAYERAIVPKLSGGLSADLHIARFKGFSGNLFFRYYPQAFNRSGIFIEAKGTYGEYNPICYSLDANGAMYNPHKADISSISVTGFLGYKWLFESNLTMDVAFGFRGAKGTFGPNDQYFEVMPVIGGNNKVTHVFYGVGPGGLVELMFNMGYSF